MPSPFTMTAKEGLFGSRVSINDMADHALLNFSTSAFNPDVSVSGNTATETIHGSFALLNFSFAGKDPGWWNSHEIVLDVQKGSGPVHETVFHNPLQAHMGMLAFAGRGDYHVTATVENEIGTTGHYTPGQSFHLDMHLV